ncbi:MAG: hypothetical protein AAGE52_23660 [Myxococcota bacterium]
MGVYDQIYQNSMRFRRELIGGQRRPRASQFVPSTDGPSAAPARFRCPSCDDPVPPAVTCSRCDLLPTDAQGQYRFEPDGLFARLQRRQQSRTLRSRLKNTPAGLVASSGPVRLKGVVVETTAAVEGASALVSRSYGVLTLASGEFWLRVGSERVLVRRPEVCADVRDGERRMLRDGDEVEVLGTIDAGSPYRSGERQLVDATVFF